MPGPNVATRAWGLSRSLGPSYVVLAAARSLAHRAEQRLEPKLLRIEGRRGVLGPAHERHAENSPDRNREHWTSYDWNQQGEEWTKSPEWKDALIAELIVPFVRTGETTVEIGPGGGRWSETLSQRASRLIVVDVTERALELTRERLGEDANVDYVQSSGSDLPAIEDGSVDSVWSWDAFVHIAPRDVAAYLGEIARVLRPGGRAVIHHSGERNGPGWRSPMSAELFANLARERGLRVEDQLSSWGGGRYTPPVAEDVITILSR